LERLAAPAASAAPDLNPAPAETVDQAKLAALTQPAAPAPEAAVEKPGQAAEPSFDEANDKLSGLLGKKS